MNKTTEEVQNHIQNSFKDILSDAVVIVRLASFRITLLGEFKRPGKYQVYQNNINIFEAISMGGDLTDFARRFRIAIIRQTDFGSEIIRVDLNDKRILESDFYYLLPNDIVYAEPIKAKAFVGTSFPYGLLFSVLSTIILIYTLTIN
jgi:polysaccharide export outer membrane protein